ncbi:MFS general substrate transporter [Mrakia frigida]|uniref:MFS general substrate transporter n=1 Tax=Mrakia frigida TaxID=29902 RepID=UPI003FCC1D3A
MSTERSPLLAPTTDEAPSPPGVVLPKTELGEKNGMSTADFRWLMTGLWTLTFIASLDSTIVATLVSSIGSSFEAMQLSSWIGTSYLLSVCCFTPLYGRLCGIIGRRGASLLAGGLFGAGTICCGLAQSMNQLIAARAFAGMGGGGMAVVGSVIVSDIIPLKQRGLYQGFTNLLFGLGAGVGGPLGGWLADTVGWRVAFLMQSPLLIGSLFILWLKIREPASFTSETFSHRQKLARIDYLGSLTLVGSIGCLLLGMSLKTTQNAAWGELRVWGLLVASGAFTVLFVIVEIFVAVEPVLPFSMLKQSNFILSFISFSMLYNVPLFFTAVRLSTAGSAGAHLIPNSICIASGSLFAGWYMRHTGRYWKLQTIGALLVIFANVCLSTWSKTSPEWVLYLSMAPSGFGFAVTLTTSLIALISAVDREHIAVATGVSYLFRTAGQVLGVSLSSTLTQSILEKNLKARIVGHKADKIIKNILDSTAYIHTLPPDLQEKATDSWALALRTVFFIQIIGAFFMFLSMLPIQEHHLPETVDAKPVASSTDEEEGSA